MGKITLLNLIRRSWCRRESYGLTGIGILKISGLTADQKKNFDVKSLKVAIGKDAITDDAKFEVLNGNGINIKGYRLILYKIKFDLKNIENYDIQNKIKLKNEGLDGIIKFNFRDRSKGHNRYGKIKTIENTAVNWRQTRYNNLMLTIRPKNYYDTSGGKIRLRIGYLLSKVCFWCNPILVYEKQCSRYEESASVLFEALVDKGYKKIKYIINKENPKLKFIDERYKKQFIYKDSMHHIISFFRCRTFIGTETIGNAMQLRSGSRIIHNKVQDFKNTFVFLQHGVMYMISLSAEQRVFFRTPYEKYRVVTSSKEEKRHFVEVGGYDEKEVWVTGLAKFDRAERNTNADKIVIMPTWRSWELALIRCNFTESGYYKMLCDILNSVPDEFKDKVIVLPHPHIMSSLNGVNSDISDYIPGKDVSYDEVLKDCKLLITDYSSISYDAFYRGANVIFCWKEKEECLSHYGESAYLMLNEKNAFGDVSYDYKEMTKLICQNYNTSQNDEYIKRFKKIVQFNDNKNTERIIESLLKENIL